MSERNWGLAWDRPGKLGRSESVNHQDAKAIVPSSMSWTNGASVDTRDHEASHAYSILETSHALAHVAFERIADY